MCQLMASEDCARSYSDASAPRDIAVLTSRVVIWCFCDHVCVAVFDYIMDRKVEQVNMKFCVKLGKSFTETVSMLWKAYGDETMSHTQCFEWHRRFKAGRTSLEDD
jgi:hypothetical protein